LTEKLADGFDTRAAKKLGQYSVIVNALKEWDSAREVSLELHFIPCQLLTAIQSL
jgi:peptide chain release factor 1